MQKNTLDNIVNVGVVVVVVVNVVDETGVTNCYKIWTEKIADASGAEEHVGQHCQRWFCSTSRVDFEIVLDCTVTIFKTTQTALYFY